MELNPVIKFLENINEKTGRFFSWSTTLLVLLICVDVIMRYAFNFSYIWMYELEIYLFAFSFILAGGYAFKHEKHVRVDLFYANYSEVKKAWINLLGGLFLLLPWCTVIIMVTFKYAMNSFKIKEASLQPGGLPAVYILKFAICIGFVLLLIQAFASILKSIKTIIDQRNANKLMS